MFLKRKKKYRELRFLFNKYFVDIWGRILKKKKVHNLTTKRFLTFFARYVTIKPLDNFRRKRRYYQRRPFIRKPRLVAAKVDQSKLKYLIRRNLASYMRHKLYPKNILISY